MHRGCSSPRCKLLASTTEMRSLKRRLGLTTMRGPPSAFLTHPMMVTLRLPRGETALSPNTALDISVALRKCGHYAESEYWYSILLSSEKRTTAP